MRLRSCIALFIVAAFMMPSVPGILLPGSPGAEASARSAGDWWGSGWSRRAPVTIDNRNCSTALENFQVPVNITYAGRMNSDFSDLRFIQNITGVPCELPFWLESRQDGQKARAWVNVSQVPAGDSCDIYMYYGNPSAASASDGNRTFDFFDDFNGPGLDSGKWNPLHVQNAAVTMTQSGGMLDFAVASGYQWTGGCVISKIPLPAGNYIAETRMKSTDYYGSAFGAYAGFTNAIAYNDSAYGTPAKLVSAKLWDYISKGWYLSVQGDDIPGMSGSTQNYGYTQITIRNIWLRMTTIYTPGTYVKGIWTQLDAPYASQSLELKGTGGVDPTYMTCGIGEYNTNEHTYFDHLLARKYCPVEPVASVGPEERPYSLRSMTFDPKRVSEGDGQNITVLLENPTAMTIPVAVSLRIGQDFASAQELASEVVQLVPQAVTRWTYNWTAVGGRSTVWCGLDGGPERSAVVDVNRDPVFSAVKDQPLQQDKDFYLQLNASDPDGDALSWSMDNPLFSLSELSNHSAELYLRPTNDDVGLHAANITVSDPMNRSVTRHVNFTVRNVNDPPSITKIPSLAATEYNELRYRAAAADPDLKWGDVLTFSDNTDIFDIDPATGEFSFTPVEEHVGKRNVKVTVTDTGGAMDSCAFTITVANVNDPPALEPIPAQSAVQGRPFQLKVAASDPDLKSDPAEKLRYSDDSPLFNMNNDTGLIVFTPTNDQIGRWDANITVTDRGGLSNTTSLAITVINVNDPPSMEAVTAQAATEGEPFVQQVNATDPDLKWGLDNLTFSDDTDIFNIDPKTGAISFTPTPAQVGTRRVTITVKDDKGVSASASFDLTIAHVNHAPFDVAIKYPVDGARLKEGDQMYLEGTAKDPDKGDVLEYTWYDNDAPAGTGRNISVKLAPGAHSIRLEVSDGIVTVPSSVSVRVDKKETVSVSTGGSGLPVLAIAGAAIVAIVAVVAVIAVGRRKQREEPVPTDDDRAGQVAEGGDVALPAIPPAEAVAGGEEARKVIGSTVERLAQHQEAHPGEPLDIGPVKEKLDMARQMLKDGGYDDALDFAMEASAAADALLAPRKAAVKKAAGKKAKKNEFRCPDCGEPLQPQWPACPACGRRL